MITISNNEVEYLISKGYKWHEDIHKTYSGHGKHYATESRKLLADLEKYRQSCIVK